MLDSIPRFCINHSQRVDYTGLPLVSWSPPVNASPSFGVLSPLPAIEIELTHIFGVLQHEIDRVRTPNAARTLKVEPLRDRLLTESLAVLLKDLAHDSGFDSGKGDAVADGDRSTVRISSTSLVDWLGSKAVGPAARSVAL